MSVRLTLLNYQSLRILQVNVLISALFCLATLMFYLLGTGFDMEVQDLGARAFALIKFPLGASLMSIGFIFSWLVFIQRSRQETNLFTNQGLSLTPRIAYSWAINAIPGLVLILMPPGFTS